MQEAVPGEIAAGPRGAHGFGYDAVFLRRRTRSSWWRYPSFLRGPSPVPDPRHSAQRCGPPASWCARLLPTLTKGAWFKSLQEVQ